MTGLHRPVGTSPAGRRVRVLLVCDTYPPVLGGSEIEAQRVSAAMIRAGHHVQVLCSGGPPMPRQRDWIDDRGVPVRILTRNSRGRWKDIVFALAVARAIWKARRNYDVVYFLMQGLYVAAGLPAAHFLGVAPVMKISGDGIISAMRRSAVGRFELSCLQKWGVPLMLLNEGMFQEAINSGFPRGQLVWMPNPVETEEFRPANPEEIAFWRTSHDIPFGALVTIYVGRLSQEKGLIGLLRGFALAAKNESRALLVLVGDGPQRAELERLAEELIPGQRQILFTGRIDVRQVPHWLGASDVFALTSPNEGFPCALVEAMSAGIAPVVSDIPANLQLVDNEVHGLTVGWDNEEAIGDAILRLYGDPGLRQSIGQRARQRVCDNYSTARIVDRYEALFAKAMGIGDHPLQSSE